MYFSQDFSYILLTSGYVQISMNLTLDDPHVAQSFGCYQNIAKTTRKRREQSWEQVYLMPNIPEISQWKYRQFLHGRK